MRRPPLLAALCCDCKGTSVVELALFFPVAAILLAGTVDFTTGFSQRLSLEQIATTTIQQAVVQGAGSDDYNYLRQSAATAADVPVGNVTLDRWLECDGERQAAGVEVCTVPQTPARFITLRITKAFTPMLDINDFTSVFGVTTSMPTSLSGRSRVRIG